MISMVIPPVGTEYQNMPVCIEQRTFNQSESDRAKKFGLYNVLTTKLIRPDGNFIDAGWSGQTVQAIDPVTGNSIGYACFGFMQAYEMKLKACQAQGTKRDCFSEDNKEK